MRVKKEALTLERIGLALMSCKPQTEPSLVISEKKPTNDVFDPCDY